MGVVGYIGIDSSGMVVVEESVVFFAEELKIIAYYSLLFSPRYHLHVHVSRHFLVSEGGFMTMD